MPEPWNSSTLLPPPVNMFLCASKFDVSALKHVFNNITKVLSKQSPLHQESAICSRFLYKYDKKFRNDIGYRNLRKVNTALKKYLALNLLKDVENFSVSIPTEKDDDLYLPTRQMLQYVILRVMAFAKIMLRICVCSKQAAVFYLDRIKRGESHWMSVLPYALLCRLWSMSMVLLQHSASWYPNLYHYLNKLELKGLNFLPDNYELPKDFEEWLDLKHVDEIGRFDWAQKKHIEIDNTLIDGDDNDLIDNIMGYINQFDEDNMDIDEKTEETKPLLQDIKPVLQEIRPVLPVTKIDHGVALSRESFKLLLNSNNSTAPEKSTPPVVKEQQIHSHEKITNTMSLKKFIDTEEKLRNESDSKSLTGHLSLMQWHALKNALTKLCDTVPNRKIDKKIQKIWKQKCLDYI